MSKNTNEMDILVLDYCCNVLRAPRKIGIANWVTLVKYLEFTYLLTYLLTHLLTYLLTYCDSVTMLTMSLRYRYAYKDLLRCDYAAAALRDHGDVAT